MPEDRGTCSCGWRPSVRGEHYAAGVRCAHMLWLIEQARAVRARGAEVLDELERQRRDG